MLISFSLIVFCAIGLNSAIEPKFRVLGISKGSPPEGDDDSHIDFAREANEWFPKAGNKYGFSYTASKDWNHLNAKDLANYEVILFLVGIPTDQTHRQAVQQFLVKGGGLMAFHGTDYNDDEYKNWQWFHQTLLGAGKFKSWQNPLKVTLHIENRNHTITKGLPEKIESAVSEWYSWEKDLRKDSDITVLATIDSSSLPIHNNPETKETWNAGFYPVFWANNKLKAIYANFGHNDIDKHTKTFESEQQNDLVINGLFWLAGKTRDL